MIKPKCKYCNKEMLKDDMDFQFKGCCDYWWYCPNCGSTLYQKERYGNICKEIWCEPDDFP